MPSTYDLMKYRGAYQQYAQDKQINGEEPLPFAQWVDQQTKLKPQMQQRRTQPTGNDQNMLAQALTGR